MKRTLCTWALTGAGVIIGVAACDNVAGVRSEPVSLTFQVPRSGAGNAGPIAAQGAAVPITITAPAQALRLDQVQLSFSRVDLQRADVDDERDTDRDSDNAEDSDRDTDSDQRDNVHLRGPFTVDLPLQGGTITPVSVNIPFGTYDEVKLRVASITICGAFDANGDGDFADAGEEFTGQPNRPCVTVPVHEKFEVDLNPPLVVDENTDALNVTVRLDPSQWFRNVNGTLIDPRRLTTDKRLRALFRARIRAALRAFEDANRNGEDEEDTDHRG